MPVHLTLERPLFINNGPIKADSNLRSQTQKVENVFLFAQTHPPHERDIAIYRSKKAKLPHTRSSVLASRHPLQLVK
jgi:hypothetical protein